MSRYIFRSSSKFCLFMVVVFFGCIVHGKQGLEKIPLDLVLATPSIKIRFRVPKSMIDGANDPILVTTQEPQFKNTIIDFARDKCLIEFTKAIKGVLSRELDERVRRQFGDAFRDSPNVDPVLIVSFEDQDSRVAGVKPQEKSSQRIRSISVRTTRIHLRLPSKGQPGYKDIFLVGLNSSQFAGNNFCSLLENFDTSYRKNLPDLHRKIRNRLPREIRSLLGIEDDYGELSLPDARGIL